MDPSYAKRYAYLKEKIAALQEELADLRSVIVSEQGTGSERYGDIVVTVSEQSRFDTRKAAAVLDSETYLSICEMKPTAKKAQERLDPEVYDSLTITNKIVRYKQIDGV